MRIKIWIDPEFENPKEILRILNRNLSNIISSRFYITKSIEKAHIQMNLTRNEDIVNSLGPSFDGLSSGQINGGFPREININKANWKYPPKCWEPKKYRKYVILHEVLHAFGLEHPDYVEPNKTKKCPIIYPQTKCKNLEICSPNYKIDKYTRKKLENKWTNESSKLFRLHSNSRHQVVLFNDLEQL